MGTPVIDLIDEYLPIKKATSTLKRNGKKGEGWDGHVPTVREALAGATVGDITPLWATNYLTSMRSKPQTRGVGYSLSTIRKHFNLIGAAVRKIAFLRNVTPPALPFESQMLCPGKWEKSRTRLHRPGEREALMAVVRNYGGNTQKQWGPLIELAMETGARMQELVLCYWHEVDFERRVLIVDETNCKTEQGREIPLSDYAHDILADLSRMRDPASDKVFHLFKNAYHASAQFRRHLAAKAGLADFHFHDHRHVATTSLRDPSQRKMDSIDVANMMGHSMETMRKVYDHTPAAALVRLMPKRVS